MSNVEYEPFANNKYDLYGKEFSKLKHGTSGNTGWLGR
jgi:hypothetical protein